MKEPDTDADTTYVYLDQVRERVDRTLTVNHTRATPIKKQKMVFSRN